jgi:uncharacterized protein YebE (UPF0316 family)
MDFFTGNSIWVYLFIFVGKIVEVTVATIRVVLINRGERKKGSLIALLEVVLWIVVTGTVLQGFTQDILKAVLYCIAFALGTFAGSWVESKIALGLSTIQVIADTKCYSALLETLRANNLAVTVVDGKGKEGDKKILFIHLKRSRTTEAVRLINKVSENCVITVSDVRVLHGGFIKK